MYSAPRTTTAHRPILSSKARSRRISAVRHRWKLLLRPLYPLVKLLCTVIVPLTCLLLDPLESKRQHSVGYEVGV